MAPRRTFGDIVRRSVGISAFIGIGVVLAGNMTGNQHWYRGDYEMLEGTVPLEKAGLDRLRAIYQHYLRQEQEKAGMEKDARNDEA